MEVLQRLLEAVESAKRLPVPPASAGLLSDCEDVANKLLASVERIRGEETTYGGPVTTFEEEDAITGLGGRVSVLTSNAGLESEVRKEVLRITEGKGGVRVVPSPYGCKGYVMVGGLEDESLLLQTRSIHEVLNFEGHFRVEGWREGGGIGQIIEKLQSMSLASLRGVRSFRVSCDRTGTHDFKSTDVERQVGSYIHETFQLPADMKGYELALRIDVCLDHVLVSTAPKREILSKRHKLAFTRTVTLKPNVAFCMIQMCQPQKGFSLLDPFCGGGTIPMEACCMLRGDAGTVVGCDRSETVVKGARANAEAARGLMSGCKLPTFEHVGAQVVDRHFAKATFDAVVTNPPWGVRLSKDDDLAKIYRGFLYAVSPIVKPGGRVVVMVQRCELFLEVVRRTGIYQVLRVCAVKAGEQIPSIFVLESRGEDVMRRDLKQQVRSLALLVAPPTANPPKGGAKGGGGGDAEVADAPAAEDDRE